MTWLKVILFALSIVSEMIRRANAKEQWNAAQDALVAEQLAAALKNTRRGQKILRLVADLPDADVDKLLSAYTRRDK